LVDRDDGWKPRFECADDTNKPSVSRPARPSLSKHSGGFSGEIN
jgi:hypothetical protein